MNTTKQKMQQKLYVVKILSCLWTKEIQDRTSYLTQEKHIYGKWITVIQGQKYQFRGISMYNYEDSHYKMTQDKY